MGIPEELSSGIIKEVFDILLFLPFVQEGLPYSGLAPMPNRTLCQ
jgi:hypothetical protein